MNVRVRYIDMTMPKLEHIGGKRKSNWVDVRVSLVNVNGECVDWYETKEGALAVDYEAGDYIQVYLGFAMELPPGYEAHVAPRGSTFKNYGLIQTNSVGVVDESYCGDNDEWYVPFYATRDGCLQLHDRIAQFRIMEVMPDVEWQEVDLLGNEDRGGHGSTGR